MANTQTIRIVVEERGSKQAAQNIRGIASAATAGDKALGLLKAALAAVGVASVIRQYVELSNTYTTLQNRIKLVTSSQQEQIAVSRELLSISNQTFTSLQDTTELYARLAFNTRNLGLTQKEVLDVTKALNQAVILSGAGSREASNAIIQLSQGLASGTLRGDELRSVLEQLPFVADIIAKSFDVDRGALRKLAADGQVTTEQIIAAFQKAAPEIAAQFSKIQPTIAQSFTVLENNVLAAVGEFNKATGASNFFANAIMGIANSIEDVGDIAVAFFDEFSSLLETAGDLIYEAFGIRLEDAKFSFRDLLRFVGSFIDTTTGLFVGAGQAIFTFWATIFNNLKGIGERVINGAAVVIEAVVNTIIAGINKSIQAVADSVNTLIDLANEASNFLGQGDILTRVDFGKLVELNLGRVDETPFKDVGEEVGNAFVEGFESVTSARDFVDDVLRKADGIKARRDAQKAGADLSGKVAGSGQQGRSKADIEVDSLLKQLNAEQELLAIGQVKGQLEFNQKSAIIKLNQKLKEDGVTLNDVQRKTVEDLIRANEETKIRNGLQQQVTQYTQDLQDQLHLLTLTTDQREVEADLLRITNAYKEAGVTVDEEAVNALRTLRTEVQQRTQDEQILNGIFGDREAVQKRLLDLERLRNAESDPARRRGIEREQAQQRINSRQGDPTLVAGFENGLDQLYLKVSDVAGGIEQAMTNAFSSAEDALVQFVQTGEFNFSGFVDSILADITRLLARQAVLAIFNAFSGGTSGAFGGVLTALAGAKAEGGPVSAGSSYLVGEKGPEVFQPNQNGTIIPNGASPGAAPVTNITVVNYTDPNMVNAALNDPNNQQTIVNIIGKNKQAVNRALGQG
jgi:lambda family phage tail tape measure protein